MNPQDQNNYDQPVACDKDGRPLYARPQVAVPPTERRQVPAEHPVTPEAAQKHDESRTRYPNLNLSGSEYVVEEVDRHWIGLVAPVLVGCLLVVILLAALAFYPVLIPGHNPPFSTVALIVLLLLFLVMVGIYIPVTVYRKNRFYLTNESVVLDTQVSLFARDEQIVSLGSVEDVSFQQSGLLQMMLGFGTIELSTNGEDHYRFAYVTNPKQHVDTINNTIESFKNAREVSWS